MIAAWWDATISVPSWVVVIMIIGVWVFLGWIILDIARDVVEDWRWKHRGKP